ncbi:uncharacterized protein si:dkey-106l3.7 [Dunckerocampus dactyliophorus]|uniref:uncharacterized protein si:dkey-106l3.7 n=1 Tax=Dunckerocampus dactyliophorus TaxID=161453 RepID=UPI002405DD9C|nr:uncharacterized protein si:dkey-106l3.7 [Dunckerocampus dactyliophorus]
MNVYRSFGNLMEVWVAEQRPGHEPEYLEVIPGDLPTYSSSSSSFLEKAAREESVDSGVETASTGTSCHTLSEMDLLESTDSYKASSSFGSASLPSSSPPPVSFLPLSSNRAFESSVFNPRVKEALQRSESRRHSEHPAADQHFSLPRRHRTSMMRSESFGLRKTTPSVAAWQISDIRKRISSLSSDKKQGQGEATSTDLSPGFCYLEHVCQMLEDIAKKQLYSRSYQMEMDVLPEDQDEMPSSQASSACQHDSKSLDVAVSFDGDDQKQLHSEDKQFKEYPYGLFRQRSASDTTLSSLHLRKLNLSTRGQQLSTRDLLDQYEDNKKQEETQKINIKNWKIKVGSLKRDSEQLNRNSQTAEPSDKSSTRRHLSQLFRRRRKTLPVSTAH